MIKYLGSKRKLIPHIMRVVDELGPITTALDAFSGTTRVSQALRAHGIRVHANDLAAYSEVFARCYVQADPATLAIDSITRKLDHLRALPGVDGYVTQTFCRQARYFQPQNGMRIDAIRVEIDRIANSEIEHAILLTSLVEAADRVDSTTGVQMAYLKQWAARSFNDLDLRLPPLITGPSGIVTRCDANELARELPRVDLAYLDPPYNQHAYRGNYHAWETIVRGDEPKTYGIAQKRIDCRTVKSDYNSRVRAREALADLLGTLDAQWILLSFSDEGHVPIEDLRAQLALRGEWAELQIEHDRYVGARIGIHSPQGEKVGSIGRLRNVEHLFLAGEGAASVIDAVRQRAGEVHA